MEAKSFLMRFVGVVIGLGLLVGTHTILANAATDVKRVELPSSKVAAFSPPAFYTDGRRAGTPAQYVDASGDRVDVDGTACVVGAVSSASNTVATYSGCEEGEYVYYLSKRAGAEIVVMLTVPIVLALGLLVYMAHGVYRAVANGGLLGVIGAFVLVFVGLSLLRAFQGQVDVATDAYALTPDIVGMGMVLGLYPLLYVILILIGGLAGLFGAVRGEA